MATVKKALLYTLTDAIDVPFDYDGLHRLRGESSHTVHFGNLQVIFHNRIVSSWSFDDHTVAVIIRVKGNLCLLAHAEPTGKHDTVTLRVLNLAKMDKVEGWLEANKPAGIDDVTQSLGKAVVASFVKTTKTQWQPLR